MHLTKSEITLHTKDHQRIAAVHHQQGHDKVVVLAHGFYNSKDAYLFRGITDKIAEHFDVIAFDFRGHGRSSGLFTWTVKECEDLRTVIAYARQCGYPSIGLMAFSLGAAVGILESAHNTDIKTIIAVSAPYDFWKIDYHFWKPGMLDDLRLNIGRKGKAKGVRPGHPWGPKTAPIDVVERISPRPVLFIHGSDDWLINVRHSRQLYNRAKEPKRLEIIDQGGHAETLFDEKPEEFMQMAIAWFKEHLSLDRPMQSQAKDE